MHRRAFFKFKNRTERLVMMSTEASDGESYINPRIIEAQNTNEEEIHESNDVVVDEETNFDVESVIQEIEALTNDFVSEVNPEDIEDILEQNNLNLDDSVVDTSAVEKAFKIIDQENAYTDEDHLNHSQNHLQGDILDNIMRLDDNTLQPVLNNVEANNDLVPAMNEEEEEMYEEGLSESHSDSSQTEYKGRLKKGRKMKHANQTEVIRKVRKNSNKTHFNCKGQKEYPKEFRDFHCKCKCNEKVNTDVRKQIFKNFWGLGNYDKQNLFLTSLITNNPIKRKRAEGSEKRAWTREYKLNNVVVCREFFVQSLRVSTKRVNTALVKVRSQVLTDQRGKHGTHNKLSDEKLQKVRDHINKIPKYKSHYCRTSTDSSFIPIELTLHKMYELYKVENEHPVSKSKYIQIFYKDFNLRRKPLKKDTCLTCDSLKAQIDSIRDDEGREKLKHDHEKHLQLVENVREIFKNDMKNAKDDEKKETLTFDLQKTLPLPRIPTNIVFYKRQVMMYNCGVHSSKNNKGYFYVWVEDMAGRGAQEIGSCLKKHVLEKCPNTEELILWSDSCGGQNRNIKITLMLKHILACHPSLKKISIKFLIPGHSFLPNDSEFGDVECHLKTHQRVYTDDDYVEIMKKCRRKNPFIVTKMKKEDFLSTEVLEENITNRKSDTNDSKINWFKFREIEVKKCIPFSIFVKSNLNQNHQEINLFKTAKRGRPCSSESLYSEDLNLRWPQGKGLSQPKMKDLKSMLHLIPNDAKGFYKRFFVDPSVVDDVDGFNAEIDFEVEDPNA